MNKNQKSKFIVLLLMILFFGIMLVPAASATPEKTVTEKEGNEPKSVDDSQWCEWKQAHTVEVEVTTVYDYKKDGKLKITETYSGEKLKGKFKVDKLTRSQTFSVEDGEEIAVSAESGSLKLKPGDQTEIVTQESILLTTEDDPYKWWGTASSTTSITASSTVSSTALTCPQWTYSKFTYFFKTYYKVEDPINLVWEDKSLSNVKKVIIAQKWVDNPVEYTHYLPYPDGSWVAGDGVADSKYRISGGYHSRLWEIPGGNVVSNAHHDDNFFIIPGHQVDGYENTETKVTGFFGTTYGKYWLDNVYYSDYYNAHNDGSVTLF
ncbi:hypothetical protein EO98_16805 [Methanosarcina sp. 2.H.T.1A.6]|uniref:hypothetical protein n=1 Tax=unclassified Methanosarcina TaxID=2644672 RepID=UPI0006217BE7|nr:MULTISPECIES: hypothetical protein [unclassified Methanosarcina]KKG13424.1 hypothetical protein EO97_10170 [Methanosarcina sp. 2.H.T.1A.15]KKG15023.1 hypothetical protein EO94_03860 [Methanosarcina sp. 2.H.T.1A.3]KKG20722.1 hypothetical protein EO96_17850 [Methanosarcina sp. 2.H.T.1A.8]KKG22039.1 hypothetical protein EO98_16805 [Methanosarcina sp. 2.H.T.1A.6]